MQEQAAKSFLREWGVLIGFGVFAVTALVGFRLWTEHKQDAPVSEAYREYLSQVSSRSKSAREYLAGYYAKYHRQTVASRHFEAVCASVTVLADRDETNPEAASPVMAEACRRMMREGFTGDVP